ncbi:hypothetical protein AMELA_G00186690 [Ameiurus melas]|uniref:Uncharacterized protein n=1 Tax=Ameiurus melas TaxID=219545 RepID=A0A7J6A7R6_AMEME|nr:hypothetical protein AMELA_G00186690 [Ameiurus melas]
MHILHLPHVFQSLKTAKPLQELHFGNVVENPSPYTVARMKAYKRTDSHLYFRSGWVSKAAVWDVKDKKLFTVRAKAGSGRKPSLALQVGVPIRM